MTWFEYFIYHWIPVGLGSIVSNFRIWLDLMTGNYAKYALFDTENAEEECKDWFWEYLGTDETLPKCFVDYLKDLSRKLERGEVEFFPINWNELVDLDELLEDAQTVS
jgi:hypothetical protein